MKRWQRLLGIFLVGLPPWVVLFYPGGMEMYFAYGIVTYRGLFISLPEYLSMAAVAALPSRLLAWPVSVVLWLLALVSAALGSYEDRRVTDGLLALAGLNQLVFVVGFWTAEGYIALPIGTALVLGLAWWDYRPAARWGSVSQTGRDG
jgi:uncharacterized protein (TIGR04206 family)